MARITKGYPFAFQILGYLKWEHNASLEEILPEFDEALASYAYEKMRSPDTGSAEIWGVY